MTVEVSHNTTADGDLPGRDDRTEDGLAVVQENIEVVSTQPRPGGVGAVRVRSEHDAS